MWVGLVDGESIGMVEFRDGHFITSNRGGREVSTSSSLPSAKAAVFSRPTNPVPLYYLVAVAVTVFLSVTAMTFASGLGS
ncbi:hypothetical protein ACEXQD_04345 [Herbiconiux sp. P15]|uniref:hypothetical protein n=1 Tax=Herbiconiux liukaitaii TaxID=3342799 RepID=UPI0035B7E868